MEWYTLGQMLMAIRIGQKAVTPDGRTLRRSSGGLFWKGGRQDGKIVEIRDYLFTDLWRIEEDEESGEEAGKREAVERKEREMLENQYEELRWEYLIERRGGADNTGRGGEHG
ncbi:hypothetical protein [Paenibacillus agri]|uniref:Uncharacterized protein n=1 Tax=Paenibacillus agri TaxID=2744309 RepID=A0A850F067_9BACL|nr:hypothetical protein [Paenibacillus agri]NUU63471.1 hypothetical protein [Paenibacillus agri]